MEISRPEENATPASRPDGPLDGNERTVLVDPLTHVSSGLLYADRLAHAIAGSLRSTRPFGVVLIELLPFDERRKDCWQVECGRQILKAVAASLRARTRSSDTLARIATDRFGLILSGVKDRCDIHSAVGALSVALDEVSIDERWLEASTDASRPTLEARIGAAIHPLDGRDREALERAAFGAGLGRVPVGQRHFIPAVGRGDGRTMPRA